MAQEKGGENGEGAAENEAWASAPPPVPLGVDQNQIPPTSSSTNMPPSMHQYHHGQQPYQFHGHPYPQDPGGGPQHYAVVGHDAADASSCYPPQRSRAFPTTAHGYGEVPPSYSGEGRNYTDSQLGVGAGSGMSNSQQLASPRNYQQQQYSTPRTPRHAAVLKDRGSTENSVGSVPSGESDSLGYGGQRGSAAKISPKSAQRNRVASSKPQQPLKDMRSPDGRHTPVRSSNNLEVRALHLYIHLHDFDCIIFFMGC